MAIAIITALTFLTVPFYSESPWFIYGKDSFYERRKVLKQFAKGAGTNLSNQFFDPFESGMGLDMAFMLRICNCKMWSQLQLDVVSGGFLATAEYGTVLAADSSIGLGEHVKLQINNVPKGTVTNNYKWANAFKFHRFNFNLALRSKTAGRLLLQIPPCLTTQPNFQPLILTQLVKWAVLIKQSNFIPTSVQFMIGLLASRLMFQPLKIYQ